MDSNLNSPSTVLPANSINNSISILTSNSTSNLTPNLMTNSTVNSVVNSIVNPTANLEAIKYVENQTPSLPIGDEIKYYFSYEELKRFPCMTGVCRLSSFKEVKEYFQERFNSLVQEVTESFSTSPYHHCWPICGCSITEDKIIYETTSGTLYIYTNNQIEVLIPRHREYGTCHSLMEGMIKFRQLKFNLPEEIEEEIEVEINGELKTKVVNRIIPGEEQNWDNHLYQNFIINLGKDSFEELNFSYIELEEEILEETNAKLKTKAKAKTNKESLNFSLEEDNFNSNYKTLHKSGHKSEHSSRSKSKGKSFSKLASKNKKRIRKQNEKASIRYPLNSNDNFQENYNENNSYLGAED